MAASVAGQEPELLAVELGEKDCVGRLAPGTLDLLPFRLFEAREVVQPRSPDDAEHRFHYRPRAELQSMLAARAGETKLSRRQAGILGNARLVASRDHASCGIVAQTFFFV
jgi:hypothetical protein